MAARGNSLAQPSQLSVLIHFAVVAQPSAHDNSSHQGGVGKPATMHFTREVLMRYGHMTSGGRYPVLRAMAILYMVSAVGVFIYGIWKAFVTLLTAQDTVEGKVVVAVGWMAGGFIAALIGI